MTVDIHGESSGMLRELFYEVDESWKKELMGEFAKPYMISLSQFLDSAYINLPNPTSSRSVYPPLSHVFSAFKYTPLSQIKVVIVGQDPYHGVDQAHGLAFSVRQGVDIPPSLRNIFKELRDDLGIQSPNHGHLMSWAKEGVLLINSVLTVEGSSPGSHSKIGWEQFTDVVLERINCVCDHVVFILWGSYAQKKCQLIDRNKHCVIESPHPSPLSAHRGFLGSKPFSKANQYLKTHGIVPPNWRVANTGVLQLSLF